MSRGEWNKKEELLAEQAAKHLRHYTPLLAAFAQTDKAELALLAKVSLSISIFYLWKVHSKEAPQSCCPARLYTISGRK